LINQPLINDNRIIFSDSQISRHFPILFASNEEEHNILVSDEYKGLSFHENIETIKNRPNSKIFIGITRENFYKLGEILSYIGQITHNAPLCSASNFEIRMIRDIYQNFILYLRTLSNGILSESSIYFVICDKNLLQILIVLEQNNNCYDERKLLRILGMIAKHVFIGPESLVIGLNQICNTNCIHCSSHSILNQHKGDRNHQLPFEIVRGIIDDAYSLKVDCILLIGSGEPLLHPSCIPILEYARKKGIGATLLTNGVILNKETIDKLIAINVSSIQCSLPAGSAKVYDNVCFQTKGHFPDIIKNLKYYVEKKGSENNLLIHHVIHNMNFHDIRNMIKTDIYIKSDMVRFHLIRILKCLLSLKLSEADIRHLTEEYLNLKDDLDNNHMKLIGNFNFQLANYEPIKGNWCNNVFTKLGCNVGFFYSDIRENGDIVLCCHGATIGNIHEMSFKDIWLSKKYHRFRSKALVLNPSDRTILNPNSSFDENCEQCENYQQILEYNGIFKKMGILE